MTMTPLKFLLADISRIQADRDALPDHSHMVSLLELTLDRLQQEADALRPLPAHGRALAGGGVPLPPGAGEHVA